MPSRVPVRTDAHNAAKFHVASQLSRLGFKVTIPTDPDRDCDLVVAQRGRRSVSIVVKGLKNTTNWPFQDKTVRADYFYLLVCYRNKFNDLASQPEVFVVPSRRLDSLLGEWSGLPEVTGIEYRAVKESRYKDAWDLLFD